MLGTGLIPFLTYFRAEELTQGINTPPSIRRANQSPELALGLIPFIMSLLSA